MLASVIIYGSGHGQTSYVDCLMFASGANTQAGLNPIDVNLLNTFQQVVVYFFTITSNPITLHTSVVFLRLYWFEKRFQGWVTDARQRRATISKAKTRPRNLDRQNEEGVNGRHITIVPYQGRRPRITNDGILLDGSEAYQSQAIVDDDDENDHQPRRPPPASSDESDTVSAGRSNSIELSPLEKPDQAHHDGRDGWREETGKTQNTPSGIKFAETVKRSDGVDDDLTKFPQRRTHAEHIAILERQRNQDNEVLRIPGPRETERGMGPRRLEDDDGDDDNNTIAMTRTVESRPDHATIDSRRPAGRRPTIVIAEPKRPIKHELTDDARAVGGTLDALRMRKPRIFNRGQKETHEDDGDSTMNRAFRTRTIDTIKSALTSDHTKDMPYLSYTPTMGRNSNFVGLTLEQREELGGIEYRSLRTLAVILLSYFWGFQLIAVTFLLPFILHNEKYGSVVDGDAVSRTWWGFWTANSAFNDLGLTLTPDSMNSFNTSEYVMMIMWFFIIIGNTGFPVMLRFVIWVLSKLVPTNTGLWEELRFLLDHPRRCFTLLFPSSANWWLFWILVALNAIDLLFFVVLDVRSSSISPSRLSHRLTFHS